MAPRVDHGAGTQAYPFVRTGGAAAAQREVMQKRASRRGGRAAASTIAPMLSNSTLRRTLAPSLALAAASAVAQTAAPPAPPPAASAAAPATAASAPTPARPDDAAPRPAADAVQRVQITGGRESDTAQRRQSTASKIVIGREEIDKFGDATVGEVLRRLPGVTTPGAPGRGGPPRLRGLGSGFTQLLIDGQRIPPGFSLESLTPEQVERIEILRAPTAETGARAIAGTINIITREGFKRRLTDLRLGFGVENGAFSPGLNWTHNDTAGDLTYNLSGSLFNPHRKNSNETRTTVIDATSGTLLEDRNSRSTTTENRIGVNLTSRLQWRLGEGGDMVALTPSVFHSTVKGEAASTLVQARSRPFTSPAYDSTAGTSEGSFTNARLNTQWRQRLGPVRLELGGSGGAWRSAGDNQRKEFSAGNATPLRTLRDISRTRENSLDLKLKASGLAGGGEGVGDGGAEHSLVAGLEVDGSQRTESKTSLQDGVALLTEFGDNLQASSVRLAAFAQDEWSMTPNWGLHAGLRWEGITTRGDNGDASSEPRPVNRSSVWTPLLHAVWKPDPKGRDQVRLSLTRSYRSPGLGSLIARPSISRDHPVSGPTNPETSPDSAGNPKLKPELASGIDIALERYLDAGGVLSANLFHRKISNLMRNQVALETVSWSASPRYVRRMQNIGDATTSGLELEAKFRLDQAFKGSTPIEVRSNLSLYRSNVKSVPGPDNRLDEQAKATANLGADYRLRSLPLTMGGNVNWVPGYTTRLDDVRTTTVSTKQVWDAYALWTINPAVGLRLLGNNLDPRDHANTSVSDSLVAGLTERSTVRSNGPGFVNWQLRLELKL